MTSSLIARRLLAVVLAAGFLLLAGCGGKGSGGGGTAQWRMLNLNSEVGAVDVYNGSGVAFPAVAPGTLSGDYQAIDANSYAIKVTVKDNPTALLQQTFSLSKDKHYTGIVTGRSGSVRMITLPEDDDPSIILVGNTKVRFYNATTDAGTFDIYVTAPGVTDLSDQTPTLGGLAPSGTTTASLSGYKDLSAGDYRLRVTGAGDINDVRLDVPLVTFASQQYSTIILTPGGGGVLVNGAQLVQQGALTPLPNTQARMRVVASAENRGSVTVQVDGATVAGSLRSPTIGPYVLLGAGGHTVNVLLDGVSVSSATRSFDAAADYTLLVYGTDAQPAVQQVADDNRLPIAGRYRIRLVNAAATTDPLTLSVDYAALLSDVPPGTASDFAVGSADSSAQIDVTSTSGVTSLFSASTVNLQSLGVYTVFMLGGNATPTGVLRKDR